MDLESIREALFQAMDEQKAADIAANENNQLLGKQKIMYTNDSRGTLYSGQPTWDRAQLASQGLTSLADIHNKYLNQKLDIWTNITKTLDQINSYNKAAEAMAKAAANVSASTATSAGGTSVMDIYNGLTGGE